MNEAEATRRFNKAYQTWVDTPHELSGFASASEQLKYYLRQEGLIPYEYPEPEPDHRTRLLDEHQNRLDAHGKSINRNHSRLQALDERVRVLEARTTITPTPAPATDPSPRAREIACNMVVPEQINVVINHPNKLVGVSVSPCYKNPEVVAGEIIEYITAALESYGREAREAGIRQTAIQCFEIAGEGTLIGAEIRRRYKLNP